MKKLGRRITICERGNAKRTELLDQLGLALHTELVHRGLQKYRDTPLRKAQSVRDELVGIAEQGVRDHLAFLFVQSARVEHLRGVGLGEDKTAAIGVEPVDQAPATADQSLPGFERLAGVVVAQASARFVDTPRRYPQDFGGVAIFGGADGVDEMKAIGV